MSDASLYSDGVIGSLKLQPLIHLPTL